MPLQPQRRARRVLLAALLSLIPAVVFADPFRQQSILLPWPDSHDVGLADFNGDGRIDIAALDSHGPFFFECYPPTGPMNCGDRMLLTLHLNEGMGRFAPLQSVVAMCLPWTMVAGDFNGDGRADVVIGNRGANDAFGVCSPASASFYPGDGNGGFGTPSHRTLAGEPTDSAAGDFNGDGIQDIVMIYGDTGVVQVLMVSLAGNLTNDVPLNTGLQLNAVAAGNLDDDLMDEIAISFRSPPHITLMDRSPAGVLVPTEGVPLTGSQGAGLSLGIADFTLDFKDDIAVGRSGSGVAGLTLLTRDESGLYGNPEFRFDSAMNPGYSRNLAAADLNADGFGDLATTDGAWHIQTLFGDGAGQFVASPPIATSGATDEIAAGDLDGDGMSDLATAGPQIFLSTGSIQTLLNETQVTDLMILSVEGQDLDWYGMFGATGYDLVRGDVQSLKSSGGDYAGSTEACVGSGLVYTQSLRPESPPVGEAGWVLGRPRYPGGPGSYDDWGNAQAGPRDPGINASPNTCP